MSELKRKAASGLIWSVIGSWGGKVVGMAIFVALARLVSPLSFGVVAMAAVFITLMDMLVQQGMTEALVQRRQLTDRVINTAFLVNASLALVFVLCLCLLAPMLEEATNTPGLSPVLRASSIAVLITALCSTQIALYRREFQYKLLAKRSIISSVVGGATGLTIALLGGEEWSLVGQTLCTAIVSAAMLWKTPLWTPKFEFDAPAFRDLISFGSSIFGSSILSFLLTKGTDLLIGAKMGTLSLGLYTVGSRATLLLLQLFTGAVSDVAMSGLSRVSNDREQMLEAYYGIVKLSSALACPVFALVAAVAPEFCIALFGPEWAQSGSVLQATALLAVVQCIQFYNATCFNASGMPRITLLLNAVKLIFVYASFLLTWKHGLVQVAYGLVIGQALTTPLNYYLAHKYLGISVRRVWGDVWPFIGSGVVTVFAVYCLRSVVDQRAPLADLAVLLIAGTTCYALFVTICGRKQMIAVITMLANIRKSRS